MAPRTRDVSASKRTSSTATRLGCWVTLLLFASMALGWCVPGRMAFAENTDQSKRTVPVPTKRVLSANSTSNDDWSAQTCAGVGDVVSYRLEATLPEDLDSYTTYSLWFNDALGDGLAYANDSVHTYVAHKDSKQDDISLSVTIDGQTMRVGDNDIKSLSATLAPSDVVVVEYDCVVRDTAANGLAKGNDNTLTLQYTHSPTQEDLVTQSIRPVAKVYSFQIDLHKVAGDDGSDLAGACFVVQNAQGMYRTASGTWAKEQADAQVVATNSNGVTSFSGLGEGTYTITETTAPAGYALLEQPVAVTLATSNIDSNERTLTASATGSDAKVVAVDAGTGIATVQVEDPKSPKSESPSTPSSETPRQASGSQSNPTSGNTSSTTTGGAATSRTSTPGTGDRTLVVSGVVLVVAVALIVAGHMRKQRARSDDA